MASVLRCKAADVSESLVASIFSGRVRKARGRQEKAFLRNRCCEEVTSCVVEGVRKNDVPVHDAVYPGISLLTV